MTNNPEKNMKIFEGMRLEKGIRKTENVQEVTEILNVSLETLEKVSSFMGDVFLNRHWQEHWNDDDSIYEGEPGFKRFKVDWKEYISVMGAAEMDCGVNPSVVCESPDDLHLANLLRLLAPDPERKKKIEDYMDEKKTMREDLGINFLDLYIKEIAEKLENIVPSGS